METRWEEIAEKRIGVLESKMDKLLDPQSGIYSNLDRMESRLRAWAIGILVALVLNLLGVVTMLATRE